MTTKTYDATKCSYTASEKVWRTKTLEASVNCFSVVKSFCDTVALSAKFQNGLTTKIDVIDKQPTTHHHHYHHHRNGGKITAKNFQSNLVIEN